MRGKRELFAELRRVSNIFVNDCLRKQFCAILVIQGFKLKFLFRYFSPFLSYLQFGWQKLSFF